MDLMLYTINRTAMDYTSDHVLKDKFQPIDLDRIAKVEYLDMQLYEWALPIFEGRVRYMRHQQEINIHKF